MYRPLPANETARSSSGVLIFVRSDGLPGARMEHGRRRRRQVGRDVVPGLRKPALVEDVLHLVGHVALLSRSDGVA